jgi:hypothetical protein
LAESGDATEDEVRRSVVNSCRRCGILMAASERVVNEA